MRGIIESVVTGEKLDCIYVKSGEKTVQFAFPVNMVSKDCVGAPVEMVKHEGQDWTIKFVGEE